MDELPEQPNLEDDLDAVILAAGMGTRMRSDFPKVLHRVAGDPMISHVLAAAGGASVTSPLVVVGHGSDLVKAALGNSARYALQSPQLGTGHAVQEGLRAMEKLPRRLLVLCGDTPLLTSSTVSRMAGKLGEAAIVLLSARLSDPTGYGRVIRHQNGSVLAIVEEADASAEQRAITEINSGLYCFDGPWLAQNLGGLKKSAKGEYYLTDLVAAAVAQGREVRAVPGEDAAEVLGVNDRMQLAEADRNMRLRICRRLMLEGVTVVDPANTYVGKDVVVGQDTVLQPGCHLRGKIVIGARCEIGPNSLIVDSIVGDDCGVVASVLERCHVADHVEIGPFSHLRPGARVASGTRLGNYAEVKNSDIGENVQMHHFSYVGDADIGDGTNVGAGTITCNFNSRGEKHRTRVGKRVFLGSDTLLIAPVDVGDGAATAAGSVVTRDVQAGTLVVGVPARVREPSEPSGQGARELEEQGEGGVKGGG